MAITTENIKELRDMTGVSVMQCKKALEEAGGDIEKARVILRKVSAAIASKKADRELNAGIVATYTHTGGQVAGVIVLASETDFVSKNEEFSKLAHDIAMHVAAMAPQFKTKDDVKESDIAAAVAVFEGEVASLPEAVREKAMQGKLSQYLGERVLMDQAFVKDPSVTVGEMISQAVQKFGEKVDIVKFERFSVK